MCYSSDFETLYKDGVFLLTLLKSETKNNFVSKAFNHFLSKLKNDFFKRLVKSHNEYQDNFSFKSDYQPFFESSSEDKLSNCYKYFENLIQNEVLSRCTNYSKNIDVVPNGYCSPKIFDYVKKIFLFFPIWTNIIQNKHNYTWDFIEYKKRNEIGQKHCINLNN